MLKSLVTKTLDKSTALDFMRKFMKRHRSPEVIVTDSLQPCPAALREVEAPGDPVKGRRSSNGVEDSHHPLLRLERAMLRFRRMKTPQKFACTHA
jgi:putative transposase